MKIRRSAALLVAVTWLAVDAALASYIHDHRAVWPHGSAATAVGLVFGQIALLCGWFVAARENLAVRLAAAAAVLSVGSLLAAAATDGVQSCGQWLTLLGLFSLLTGGGLMVARAWAAVMATTPGDIDSADASRPRYQLTLAQLFTWTTSVAVILGMRQALDLPNRSPLALGAFCVGMTVPSLALIWLSQQSRLRALQFFTPLCTAPLLTLVLPPTGIPPLDLGALLVLGLAHGCVIVGTLCIVRVLQSEIGSPSPRPQGTPHHQPLRIWPHAD